MESSFRRRAAYQRSIRLADEVYSAVATWGSVDRWSLGVQLLRSVDSIGANIAEGAGRVHTADRRRFFVIARGSLFETEHWLARAKARGLTAHPYGDQLTDIARALSGLIKNPGPS
jgi:four helix bundle protein